MRRFILVAALAFACAGGAMAQAVPTLPSVTIGSQATPVTPSAALTYYQGVGLTSSARASNPDPEIVELARALKNDPDLIYEWVRNNVEVTYIFGLQKGARGAAIDKSGTPFDQAHLMVELLRASGYTAKYQYGTITLTGTEFNDWFGITDADAAEKILASGGFPATVSPSSGTITSVTLSHLWVKVTINGTDYLFDPAYKGHVFKTGIDIGAAMGFNGAPLVATTQGGGLSGANIPGSGLPRMRNAHETNIWSILDDYAGDLLTYLKTNMPTAEMQDVIGGQRIAQYTGGPLRQTTLPYTNSVSATWDNDVPNVLRTTIRFRNALLDHTVYVDEIYGKVFAITVDSTVGGITWVLTADSTILHTGSASTGVPDPVFTIDINRPYAAHPTGGTANGAYLDTQSKLPISKVLFGIPNIVVASFGDASPEFAARIADRAGGGYAEHLSVICDAEGGSCEEVSSDLGYAALVKTAASWPVQYARMAEIYSRLSGTLFQNHGSVGFVSLPVIEGVNNGLADQGIKINIESQFSLESRTGDAAKREAALQALVSGMNTLEGSMFEQMSGSFYPISVAAKIDWLNRTSIATDGDGLIYYATSANWNSIKTELLTGQHQEAEFEAQAQGYIDAGYTLVIPVSSNLGPGDDQVRIGSAQDYCDGGVGPCYRPALARGGVIIAYKSDFSSIAYIVVRNDEADKGGGGEIETDPQKLLSPEANFLEQQFETRAKSYDVDLQTGTLTYTAPADLVVGNGDFPYSLSFQRTWRAGWYQGWSHNWQSSLQASGNALGAMGDVSPQAATETIAAFWAQIYLAPMAQTDEREKLKRHVVAAMVNMWWAEKIAFNTVTVSAGAREWSFTRLPDGTWLAPPGDASVLTVPSTFERLFDASSSTLKGWYTAPLQLKPGGTNSVTCSGSYVVGSTHQITLREKDQTLWTFNRICSDGSPRYAGGYRMTRIDFPYGMNVTATYTPVSGQPAWGTALTSVQNNLGRTLTFTYPSGGATMNVADNSVGGTPRTIVIEGQFGAATQSLIADVTDPLGNVTEYTYTTNGSIPAADPARLKEVFYPTDTTTPSLAFAYDHLGRVKTMTDALGHVWDYRIANGRRGGVSDPLGAYAATLYDDRGLPVAGIDAHGYITRTEYDGLRRRTRVTAPEGNYEAYTYDAKHNVLTTTAVAKSGSGLSNIVTSATYHSTCNTVLTSTDALGRVTTNTYNGTTCTLTTTTGPAVGGSSPVTAYTYNSYGQLLTFTDPTSLVTAYTYSATTAQKGFLLTAVANSGSGQLNFTTSFVYDDWGNMTAVTDPRGNAHAATYDLDRRITQWTAPTATNAVTKWTYNANGLITKIESATGDAGHPWAETSYTYWETGRVKTMTDPDGRVTSYDYDAANRILMTTDPVSRKTYNVYDQMGRVVQEIRGYTSSLQQVYAEHSFTANGKEQWVEDARDNRTTMTYDGFDRVKRMTFADTTYEELTYDANANPLTRVTRSGVTLTHTYDALDRVATKAMPLSGGGTLTTSWTYDLAGRVLTLSDTAGHTLTYSYDSAKRVSSLARVAPGLSSQTVSFQYDAASNRTRLTWPDGYYVQYSYDALNRMTGASENGSTTLATYTLDRLSRRTALTYGNGATVGYTYSWGNDLLTIAHAWTGGGNTFTQTYTNAHQLYEKTVSVSAYEWVPASTGTDSYAIANALNQYPTVTPAGGSQATLTYDANGNLTSDGTLTLTYDAENRLLTAVKSGMSASYLYDPLGRRVRKTVDGTSTYFLHDGGEEIAEYDGSGTLLRRYIPGPGTDEPIAMVAAAGARTYFHEDRIGNVVAMSGGGSGGSLAEGPYTYDPYGKTSSSAGVPFKFTGRRLDPETGLYYFRARYYSPATGRFLQVDPVGYTAGMNLYGYVGNDPANSTDPSGLCGSRVGGAATTCHAYSYGRQKAAADTGKRAGVRQPRRTAVRQRQPEPPLPDEATIASKISDWPVVGYRELTEAREDIGQGSGEFGACRGTNCSRSHEGIDAKGPRGTVIVAIGAGTIVDIQPNPSATYGFQIVIDHGDLVTSHYAHLENIFVEAGQHVAGGEPIGLLGISGNPPVGGDPHLHMEIRIGGPEPWRPVVDPMLYLPNLNAQEQ